MTPRFLVPALTLMLSVFFLTGCPSKAPKPDALTAESGNAGSTDTSEDKNIQNQDMALNASGSDSGKIDGLYSVHFPYDKSSLNEEARSLLAKDADWMKAHAGKKVQIEGHCDRHGSIEYNLALGERRAKIVRTYLENLGIPAKQLPVISYGKEKMLDSAENDGADSKNRRANLVPLGK